MAWPQLTSPRSVHHPQLLHMMVLMAMTPIAAAASARELQNLDSRLEASASQSLCEASEEKAEALSLSKKNTESLSLCLVSSDRSFKNIIDT